MIKINFDSKRQYAIITRDEYISDMDWADIRRVCEERSSQSIGISPQSIFLHWSDFLKIRSNLSYILSNNNIEYDLSEAAESLLIQAINHEDIYNNINNTESITLDEVYTNLKRVGFARHLTPEQARNVSFLIRLPSAATFSVPGAGKTTEALAYFALKRKPNSKLLVIAPKNAFAVWEEELINCLPDLNISITRLQGGIDGIKMALLKNPTISLITYQQFSNVDTLIGYYLSQHPCFMFLDESHRMKRGYEGVHGSSILNLSFIPEFKLILSGTPMPNKIDDLIPQFNFLYPEIRVNNDSISEKIKPIYVRTTKEELGLKPPMRIPYSVPMGPAQRRLYDNIRSEAARQIEGLSINEIVRLRSFNKNIMRLMQVTTDPALLADTDLHGHPLLVDAIAEGRGSKIIEACKLARNLSRESKKCIIWSQFVQIVEYVSDTLSDLGAEYIHGGVETDEDEENVESREAKIKRFHDDPSCKVLVANPAACSEGISLHKICHHAIYIDRNYNAAQYLQSEDRIHRLGLGPNEQTNIIILACPDSIDDSINRRLQDKVTNMGRVLNDHSLNIEPIQLIDETTGLVNEDIDDIRHILLGDKF